MQIKGNIKYLLIAIIVVFLVFSIGALFITTMDGVLQTKQIEYSNVVVKDKYINNDSQHYYVVVSESGDVYDILNSTESNEIYDNLQVGSKYKLVTQKPISDKDKYIHIIQVFNETN